MTRSCICLRSRPGAAIVALFVTAGFTCALANAQAKQRPADQRALEAQVHEAFGLRDSTIVSLALPDAPGRPFAVGIQINGQGYTLDLRPHSVRAENFVCYEVLPDRTMVEVDLGPERTLRGTVRNDRGSIVAGSLLEDGLYAMMLFANGERYWMEPLAGRVAGAAPGSHVIYHSDDVLEHDGVCGTPDGPGNFAEDVHADDGEVVLGGSDCIAQIACQADFPYFQRYGTISAVASQIGNVINVMNVQYENDVDITHVITALLVHTTAASDPYTTTDSFDLVCQLGNYWDANLGVVGRDTVQLFTGRDIDGGTIGRAAQFGGICDGNACGFFPCDGCNAPGIAAGHYSFVQSDFNNNFGCATDLSAHELGHLWDAHHCACPACTMNPVITCANSFCGPGVQAAIIAFRNSVTCLDCTGEASFCGDTQAGICYTSNASPYCDDADCCATVCAVDSFCCNNRWDQICANEALDLCGSCGDPAAGDCFSSNGNPGCDDADCCAIICMFDDFCCDVSWDGLCAAEAAEFCEPGPGGFVFFTNPGAFFAAIEAQGKVSKGFWDFKPNNVEPGFIGAIDDPLNFITAPGTGFWDNMPLDNIQFQSNLNPQGEGGPNPRGAAGLAFATAPFFGIKNNILVANTFVDSYDILSGVPVGDNHTAMAMNVVSLASGGGTVHITVWDKNEEQASKLVLNGPWQDNEKRFVGILAIDEKTIGRVNIYDNTNGAEGISAIEVFVLGQKDDCPWDFDSSGSVGATDLLKLLSKWGPCDDCNNCPWDFDGNCNVGATDLLKLLSKWGPCPGDKECKGQTCETYTFDCNPDDPSCVCYTSPNGAFCGPGVPCDAQPCDEDGDCPPGFRCAILTCCGDEGICIPLCETGLGADIPAGVRTSTGG